MCLTHIEDVASLVAAAIGHPNALSEAFNCGSDRYVTYKGLCKLVAAALNVEEAKTVSYDPKQYSQWKAKDDVSLFPFRRETFVISVDKAKLKLGWLPKHDVVSDMSGEAKDYLGSSRASEEWTDAAQLKYDAELLSKA